MCVCVSKQKLSPTCEKNKPKRKIRTIKKNQKRINQAIELFATREDCDWISVNHKEFSGTYDSYPTRDLLSNEINENYSVELYSR